MTGGVEYLDAGTGYLNTSLYQGQGPAPFRLNAFGVLALAYALVWLRTCPTAALREQNVSQITSQCVFCYVYIRSISNLGAQPEGRVEELAPTTHPKARRR